eukprot:gene7443-20680_t
MLYIPVGLAVNCEWRRLSMDDCVGREGLGEAYCSSLRRDSHPDETHLWDYSRCRGTNTMRSTAQFGCILLLHIAMGTFYLDFSAAPRVAALEAAQVDERSATAATSPRAVVVVGVAAGAAAAERDRAGALPPTTPLFLGYSASALDGRALDKSGVA